MRQYSACDHRALISYCLGQPGGWGTTQREWKEHGGHWEVLGSRDHHLNRCAQCACGAGTRPWGRLCGVPHELLLPVDTRIPTRTPCVYTHTRTSRRVRPWANTLERMMGVALHRPRDVPSRLQNFGAGFAALPRFLFRAIQDRWGIQRSAVTLVEPGHRRGRIQPHGAAAAHAQRLAALPVRVGGGRCACFPCVWGCVGLHEACGWWVVACGVLWRCVWRSHSHFSGLMPTTTLIPPHSPT